MSLQACAEIVERGDPDRFLATMSVPPEARAKLFPIFAFNVEVARAPWVTEEPMIAEMRLQWWRDVLEEIASGGPVRRHEVATPLAEVLDTESARLLDGLVSARRWDAYRDPFEDEAHFRTYLDATSGSLLWAAARSLGVTEGEAAVREIGWASGLAHWFLAVPELEARGRVPMVDGRPATVADLAREALKGLNRATPPHGARPALRSVWRAKAILHQARRHPERVAQGTLHQSEFSRRGSLLIRSLLGR